MFEEIEIKSKPGELSLSERVKQYTHFNDKVCKDLDQLNKEEPFKTAELIRLLTMMEALVDEQVLSRNLFYLRSVNMKLVSFLERVGAEVQERIFSVLNAYLPIVTPQALSSELEEYLQYLVGLLQRWKPVGKSAFQILYKVASCRKQPLVKSVTRTVLSYLEGDLVQRSIAPVINIILDPDRQLSLVNAELDVKSFIYDRYRHRINAFHPLKEHLLEIDIREFVGSFPKYEKDQAIYEVSKRLFAKRKNKNKCFFYDCRKEESAFHHSVFAGCDFVSYPLKDYQKSIVRSLIALLVRSAPAQHDEFLTQLHRVLSHFRILLPYALWQKVQGTTLLQWLLNSQTHSKRRYKLLLFLLLNNNIFIKKEEELYGYFSIADYVSAIIIRRLINSEYSAGQHHSLFAAYYLQQVRRFSEFCTTPLAKDNPATLVSFLQHLFQKTVPLQHLAISELLNFQYKRALLNNLKRKYKIVGSQTEPTFQRQFLNASAFYCSLQVKEIQANLSSSRRQVIQGQQPPEVPRMPVEDISDSDEENAGGVMYADLMGRHPAAYLQGLSVGNRPQELNYYEQIIWPLPQKPLKEGEEQPQLQPIVCLNNYAVQQVIELFQKYLAFDLEVQDNLVVGEPPVPQKTIAMNENQPFKISLQDNTADLQIKVKKNAVFERHFGEILKILDPKLVWEEKRPPPNNFQRRVQQISRRMFTGENREQLMHHLERLMIHQNREDIQQQAPPRLLNASEIYNNIPEFTDPIIPPQPQTQPAQELPKQAQKVEQPIVAQEVEIPIEPVVNSEIIQPVPQPIEIEQALQQIQQQIAEQPNEPSPVVIEPAIQPQPQIIAQQQQQEQQLPAQIPLVEQPVVVPLNAQQPQPPIRDREILRVYGLPQTFLRDAGIDEETFDFLPEDLQQEQLMSFISQQNQANRQNANNTNNANNPDANNNPPPVADLQSDNVAFLASLDMHTRAQVLIEATPQFLSTLPAHIRQEAENYRHQQINRIIEEEEMEEERKMDERHNKKVAYPKVYPQEFSPISDAVAKKLFQGIFYIVPNFKLPAVKILLENKQTQNKALTSIIGLLRYLERSEENRWFSLKKLVRTENTLDILQYFQWSQEETRNVRITLLHTIYEHLRIPFYKDEDFLAQPLPINGLYLEELQKCFQEEQVEPRIELFEFALRHYPPLTTDLIKGITELPDRVLVKIIEGIRADSLPKDFYDNLQNFSDNQRLKQLFNDYFHQQKPKIEIMGKLLKYSFSHITSLHQIHQKALENFSGNYLQFLNQIYRIYTVQSLGQMESVLVKYKHVHFEVIKFLLQLGKEIDKEPIGILLKRPQLMDFETKKFIFRNHSRIRRLARHRVHIEVDRAHLFQGSYNQLMNRSVRELEGRIQVSFVNEPGYDAGGLKREWFLVVSREIFNQDYALFEKSSSGSTYQPNPKSYVNPDHLNYFKFIGRFIGKALVERELIDAYFTRAFYKMILGQQLEFKDLQAQDYEFYKSMEWLKNNPIDENMFTFSYIYDNFGNRIEKELVPGGKAIIVNEQNKKDYIEKYCLAKMRDDFSAQVNKFLEGFHQMVPQECISYFEAKELQLLISGVPEVDVEDLKKNTDYSGYTPTDQVILWFWEVVEEYSQQDLAKLVQFITGTSKIPVEGFSQLVGMNGIQRISIHRDPYEHQLPKSHTCFNQLDLPNYPTKEILKQKLDICLAWGSEGFGFM